MTSSRSPAPRHAFPRIRPQTPQKNHRSPHGGGQAPPPGAPVRPRGRERPPGGAGQAVAPGWARAWLEARRAGLRPWGSFLDQRRFGVPRDLGELLRRLGHNAERFQSNYLLLFLGLVLYCLVTSPLLLVAVGVFVGAAIAVRLRAREAPLVLLGRELTPAHQLGVAGGVSLPLFWLAGAGAAVFWVLGAALVFLGSHAAFRQLEPPETPELQMEPV